MNAATKDKVKNDQNYKVVEKAYFITNKDMENKKNYERKQKQDVT